MTSTTSDPLQSDLTAADVAWDLEPLVDGRGAEGVDALLDDAEARAHGSGVVPRPGRGARRRGPGRADARAGDDRRAGRTGRFLRRAAVRGRHRRPGAGALMARAEERGTAISNEILFVELEWAAVPDEQAEALLADDRLAFCRHYLASARRYRPHLLSEPEERILADKSLTANSAWVRLFSELTSAITVDLDGSRGEPRAGALAAHVARPRGPARRRRGGHRRAGARAAHARVRVQHAARRQVDRRPAAALPQLDREPEPRQRGERRVGAGARRRGAGPLRHPAAVVRAEGAAARAAQARRLRPHGVGRDAPTRSSVGTRPDGWCSTRTRRSRRSWRRRRSGSSTSRGSTRRSVRASVPARSARTPCRASTRTCCSTGPRADATCSPSPTRWVTACTRTSRASRGSSTRPRRSPSPRPRRCSARRSRSVACSTPPTTRPRAWRCSPRASKVRSRPCSARSR